MSDPVPVTSACHDSILVTVGATTAMRRMAAPDPKMTYEPAPAIHDSRNPTGPTAAEASTRRMVTLNSQTARWPGLRRSGDSRPVRAVTEAEAITAAPSTSWAVTSPILGSSEPALSTTAIPAMTAAETDRNTTAAL